MSKKVENAKSLYLEGINQGNYKDAIYKYTGDVYKQHSSGVKDGQEGFIEFFEDFVKRNPVRKIEIVKSFDDGQYIFIQAFQSLNNGEAKWVTTDFFDTDSNDKIIEHWDVISEYYEENEDGNSLVNGNSTITDLKKTNENKTVVRQLIEGPLSNQHYNEVSSYFDNYVSNHIQGYRNGSSEYVRFLKENNVVYKNTRLLIGQGNMVAVLARVFYGEKEMCQTDLFRLANSKVVEYWRNVEEVSDWQLEFNSGKF